MEIKLQNMLFPDKDRYSNYDKLFFKSIQAVYDEKEKCLAVAKYNVCDFMTYLNALSIKKWKEYTKVNSVKLKLNIKGSFELLLTGYHLNQGAAQKSICSTYKYDLPTKQEIEIEIPNVDETMLAFELNAKTDVFLYEGAYYTEIEERELNHVVLSIATTTFQKEDFIKKNLKMIREELFSDRLVGENIYVHVVDNGRTLDRSEIESEHIFYHPNKNVGGSGGFTRGMIESIRQTPKATNVLLMDDDVEILSESIRKTYILLLLQKEEYKEHFISGAMLKYENMDEFHEDVGIVDSAGYQKSLKSDRTVNKEERFLFLEEFDTNKQRTYAGWWYCCIPTKIIEKSGYSLPLFIRMDDTEYSLRNNAKFITMNGICVWHMGFLTKFNYFMEYYQVFRNFLITEACNKGNMQDAVVNHYMGMFLTEILRFNYKAAEFLLDAIRDYLKGPSFIEEEKCQERLSSMSKRNAVLKNIEELTEIPVNISDVYILDDRKFLESLLYKVTFNGHILWPKSKLRNDLPVVAYDWFYNPQRQAFRKRVISVNPFTKEGEIREQNRKEFKRLIKEAKIVIKEYKKNKDAVNEEYYKKRSYLVSNEFWEKYLELEKYQ